MSARTRCVHPGAEERDLHGGTDNERGVKAPSPPRPPWPVGGVELANSVAGHLDRPWPHLGGMRSPRP